MVLGVWVRRVDLAVGVMLFGVLVAGCGSGGDEWTKSQPKTVPASGRIYLDGKPLDTASIVFTPVPPAKHAASAISDSDGAFVLNAFSSAEGAVPGKYLISVRKEVEAAGKAVDPSTFAEDAGHAAAATPSTEWKNVLPSKYESPDKSGIEIEIPASGTSDLKLELKSKP